MAKGMLIHTGVRGLNRLLNALGSERARRLNQSAMRDAMKLVMRAAEQEIPVSGDKTPGTLRRSLSVRAMKRKKNRIGMIVTQNLKKFRDEAYYGAFVEIGHRTRGPSVAKLDMSDIRSFATRLKKPRDSKKKVEGKWYMRHASMATEQDALTVYYDGLEKLIKAEANASGND